MFSTETNLKFLGEPDIHLFGDGTLQYCPKFLFLTTLYNPCLLTVNTYLVCSFFFLTSVRLPILTCFMHLVHSCSQVGVDLNIAVLHLNIEISIHETVGSGSIWPNVIIKACRIHLEQTWYRKIQNHVLSKEYKDPESDIGKWFNTFFGLRYLDTSEVADYFAFYILPDAPGDEKAMEFADYILNTYVNDNSKLSCQLWADPNLDTKRTTNGCENFHTIGNYVLPQSSEYI